MRITLDRWTRFAHACWSWHTFHAQLVPAESPDNIGTACVTQKAVQVLDLHGFWHLAPKAWVCSVLLVRQELP
jgi:hypothetical protein